MKIKQKQQIMTTNKNAFLFLSSKHLINKKNTNKNIYNIFPIRELHITRTLWSDKINLNNDTNINATSPENEVDSLISKSLETAAKDRELGIYKYEVGEKEKLELKIKKADFPQDQLEHHENIMDNTEIPGPSSLNPYDNMSDSQLLSELKKIVSKDPDFLNYTKDLDSSSISQFLNKLREDNPETPYDELYKKISPEKIAKLSQKVEADNISKPLGSLGDTTVNEILVICSNMKLEYLIEKAKDLNLVTVGESLLSYTLILRAY